jgi:acyl-CoA thioesterase
VSGSAVTLSAVERQALAERSARALYDPDRASQALGMRITAIAPRACTVRMTVRGDMTNGHAICHGGIIFALADSAFAFACNSGGEPTVAASASIDFLAPAREGDELTAAAHEVWSRGRSGIYEVVVTNQAGAQIALFRGRSHRVSRRHETQDRT